MRSKGKTLVRGAPLDDIHSLVALRLSGRSRRASATLILRNEWIGVFLLIQVAEGVVYAAMARLISTDVQDKILHTSFTLRHLPILDSEIGNHKIRIGPFRQVAFLDLLDTHRVRVNSLFFEVANKPVRDLGGNEIRYEEGVEVYPLSPNEH